VTKNPREERPRDSAPGEVRRGAAPDRDTSVEAGAPRKTAPEVGAANEAALSQGGIARPAAATRWRAGPAGAVRDSAGGVMRGSAAMTHEGVAIAERASRVTYWPAQLCVLAAILLQVALPDKLTVGPTWLLPALEGVLLIGLAATTPHGRVDEDHLVRRRVAIGLIAFVNAANAVPLYLLAHELLHKHIANGRSLILSGIAIWLTNVLIFSLWYWELDRGGPANRARHPDPTTPEGRPDFVFAEMDGGLPYVPQGWVPGFIDYLALAVTTATAFSPAETMPISQRAKVLMSTQALISLVTLGLIISRAVGILG
jgi:hypothetical protein